MDIKLADYLRSHIPETSYIRLFFDGNKQIIKYNSIGYTNARTVLNIISELSRLTKEISHRKHKERTLEHYLKECVQMIPITSKIQEWTFDGNEKLDQERIEALKLVHAMLYYKNNYLKNPEYNINEQM